MTTLFPTETLLSAAPHVVLVNALYVLQGRLVQNAAASGAVSVNAAWETSRTGTPFIEEKAYGAGLVQAGTIVGGDALVQEGLHILDWGWQFQGADGGFGPKSDAHGWPGTGDPNHSTSIFLEAGARAGLLLEQSGGTQYAANVEAYKLRVSNCARWLVSQENWLLTRQNEYAHKFGLWAAGVGQAAQLAGGDAQLTAKAASYAQAMLAKQTAAGVFPERGGFDASYQMLGIVHLCRYWFTTQDAGVRAQVAAAVARGCDAELSHVAADGAVSMAGSTRTGHEMGRSDKVKGVDYLNLLQAFALVSAVTGDAHYTQAAAEVAAAKYGGRAGDYFGTRALFGRAA